MTSYASALIIEDDQKLASIFAAALKMVKFDPEIIHDGHTASTRLAATIPDLVVLDLHLPYVSGQDLLKQIRADARLTQTRVIIVTADSALAENLQEADLTLLKPVSMVQLRDLALRLRPPNPVGH